jgi:DNA polymerase (family 10)
LQSPHSRRARSEADAHSTTGLDCLKYGILQARRAGLTKADVANTRSWAQVRKMIGKV